MIHVIGNELLTEGRLHIFAAGERAELPIVPKPVPSISAVRLLITFSNSGRNGAMLTERFDEAFRYAHRLHRDQTRKGTSTRLRVNQIAQRFPVHAAVGVWAVTTRVEVPPLLRREVRVRLRLQRLARKRRRHH